MPNTWNQSGTTWNTGRWGYTDALTSGWGVEAWDTGGSWGQVNDEIVFPTGLSFTASLGTAVASAQQGWGRDSWGQEPWGESYDPVVKPSGLEITSSIGSSSVSTEINAGWGRDGWGEENYGQSAITFELTAPDAITSNVSANAWNEASWGEGQGWGIFSLSVADVMGLTGVSTTVDVGKIFPPEQVQGLSITSSVGLLQIGEATIGLTGQSTTASVGSITPADVVGITGVSATASVDDVVVGKQELISITGISATVSVGNIDPIPLVVGLTGQTITPSIGSITLSANTVGLTGQEITSSVAAFGTASGFGIQAYSNVDTGSNSSYTDVATGSNTSYSDAA